MAQIVKNLPAMWETRVQSLGRDDPLEKEMATHSSILAWKIPRAEEPGRLQSMGLQSVGHNWATNTFIFFLVNYETWGWFGNPFPKHAVGISWEDSLGNCALKHCSFCLTPGKKYTHMHGTFKKSKEGIHLKMEDFPPFSGFTTSSSLGDPTLFLPGLSF